MKSYVCDERANAHYHDEAAEGDNVAYAGRCPSAADVGDIQLVNPRGHGCMPPGSTFAHESAGFLAEGRNRLRCSVHEEERPSRQVTRKGYHTGSRTVEENAL